MGQLESMKVENHLVDGDHIIFLPQQQSSLVRSKTNNGNPFAVRMDEFGHQCQRAARYVQSGYQGDQWQ